jgi:hypothetical protein
MGFSFVQSAFVVIILYNPLPISKHRCIPMAMGKVVDKLSEMCTIREAGTAIEAVVVPVVETMC